ncbi:hypothetical protein [Candidatus Xianfuyuplasma coldseepsis]|uniref:Uncharacterized protein n=1 Tax=Candidatus Xianfuyuplasma coldseepsis TaxID=2782163 RepID=A0A7L7KQX8_9MOLU|nr:hypothetical protein [Xianfuyuplasma coldseepsis]QMS85133.1 hypothetical protein G4Z02_05035 [Xianfuyuplasma coldseepsis]
MILIKKYILIVFSLLLLLSSCSNDQIKDAIDQCKGDPECYVIIDEAIEEELALRGITGGTMTSIEMQEIMDFLGSYIQGNSVMSNELVPYALERIPNIHLIVNLEVFQSNEYHALSEYAKYLDLATLNQDFKQYFIVDDERFIIYKTGVDQYLYEINTDQKLTFTIDLGLQKLYLNNMQLPQVSNLEETLLNDETQFPPNVIIDMYDDFFVIVVSSNRQFDFEENELDDTFSYRESTEIIAVFIDTTTGNSLHFDTYNAETTNAISMHIITDTSSESLNINFSSFTGTLNDLATFITTDDVSVLDHELNRIPAFENYIGAMPTIPIEFEIPNQADIQTVEKQSLNELLNDTEHITTITYDITEESGTRMYQERTYYDGNELIALDEYYDSEDNLLTTAIVTYLYGVESTTIETYYESGEVMAITIEEFTHDSEQLEFTEYDEDGNKTLYSIHHEVYGISETTTDEEYYSNGQVNYHHSETYIYIDDIQTTFEIYYNEDGSIDSYLHSISINGEETYYDVDGNIIE